MTLNLQETSWFDFAKRQYASNNCAYHNENHIYRCYLACHHLGIEMTPALEIAIMFHDIVYDDQPEKEFRSACAVPTHFNQYSAFEDLSNISQRDLSRATSMILATENHRLEDWPTYCAPMIMADLYDLTLTSKTVLNYGRIMEESMELYGVDEIEFAKNNIKFMENLSNTCHDNVEISDPAFWWKVLEGCELTIELSNMILDR